MVGSLKHKSVGDGTWLVVSTHLKNVSQNGNLPQIAVKIKKYLKPPPRTMSFEPC